MLGKRPRPRRRSRLLRIAKGIAVALIVVVPVIGVALLAFDWNWIKSAASDRLGGALGRDVAVEGDLDVDLSWVPRITANGIRVANADWAGPDDMVRIERLQFRIDLWELLKGSVVLPEISVAGGRLNLARDADGKANWELSPFSEAGAAAEAVTPDERHEFPVIGRLSVERTTLRYRDAVKGIDLDADLAQAKGQSAESAERVSLRGKGTFEGKPFTLAFDGGSVLHLQDKEKPYPLRIEAHVGKTVLAFDGTLTNPLQPEVFDIALKISGATLSDLFPLFGIPLPPTPPYSLAGRLKRDGALWTVAGLDGRVGDSDLSGDLAIDTKPVTPFMKATLVSRLLDFDDLAGFIGAVPQTGPGETASAEQKREAQREDREARILPDMPVDLKRLRAMDMEVDFTGARIEAPNLPLDKMHAVLTLKDGVLTLKPVTFGVANGTVGGTLVLDGRKDTPHVTSDLTLRGLSVKPFLTSAGFKDMADLTDGRFGGRVVLAGDGRSLGAILASSDGETTVAMVGGTMSPLLVELIGLDIAQALAIVVTDKNTPVEIRCAFGQFKVTKGVMKTDGLVIDTTDSTLLGNGVINLGTEKLALHVQADPKDVSPLSANAPIAIMGPFRNPEVSIDPTHTAGEGLLDSIVSLADPLLALLPVVDLGTAEDRDCRALLGGDVKGSEKKPGEKTTN